MEKSLLDSEVVFGLNKDISNDSMESVNKNTNIGKNIYFKFRYFFVCCIWSCFHSFKNKKK